jgi:myosin heavy subunit
MSYRFTFRGQRYATLEEAERARREYEAQEEAAKARRALERVSELGSALQQRERELEAVRREAARERENREALNKALAREREITQGMQQDLGEMQRIQARLERDQEQARERAEQALRETRERFKGQEARIAQAEKDHADHVRQVEKTFAVQRQEIQKAQDQSDAAVRKAEEAMRETERKFEEERVRRVNQAAGAMAQAKTYVQMAREIQERVRPEVARLDLEGYWNSVETAVKGVDLDLPGEPGPEHGANLAIAKSAFLQATTLERVAAERSAALEAARKAAVDALDYAERQLADPSIQEVFKQEKAAVQRKMAEFRGDMARRFGTHAAWQAKAEESQEFIEAVHSAALRMIAEAPTIKAKLQSRDKYVVNKVRELKSRLGACNASEERFARADDPKSEHVLDLQFGGTKVEVVTDLEGNCVVHGFGHHSASECDNQGRRVLEALSSGSAPAEQHFSHAAVKAPPPPPRAQEQGMDQLHGTLERIEGFKA